MEEGERYQGQRSPNRDMALALVVDPLVALRRNNRIAVVAMGGDLMAGYIVGLEVVPEEDCRHFDSADEMAVVLLAAHTRSEAFC